MTSRDNQQTPSAEVTYDPQTRKKPWDFSTQAFGRKPPFKDPAVRIQLIDTLKKAGFS